MKIQDGGNDSMMLEAAQLYANEAVPRLEEHLARPADSYEPPKPPWCSRDQRREPQEDSKEVLWNN
jgi:hypothetical protein